MLAQALPHLALDFVCVVEYFIERAVFAEQLSSCFLANAGHAGDVVARVALEAEEVRHLSGRHAVALEHGIRCHDGHIGHAFFRRDDARLLCSELIGVFVAGDEENGIAVFLPASRHRAQNIVAFEAVHRNAGDVHRLEETADNGKLDLEGFVHRRTLGLVALEKLHAPIWAVHVPGADDGIWMIILDELEQHLHEAEHSVCRRAIGRVHRRLHGMIRTVEQGVSIYNGNRAIGHKDYLSSEALLGLPMVPRSISAL